MIAVVDGGEGCQLAGGKLLRLHQDDPGYAFGAGRRRQRPAVLEAGVVGGQQGGGVDLVAKALLRPSRSGQVRPYGSQGGIFGPDLEKHGDYCQLAGFILMHQVQFERRQLAVDLMLAGRMKVELLQVVAFAAQLDIAARRVDDLDGVSVVDNRQRRRRIVKGDVGAVKAAVDSGVESAQRIGEVVTSLVIARPHNDINKIVIKHKA